MEAETIAREKAAEGVITPSNQTPEIDSEVEINIRQDELTLFETESGRQFFRTPDMDAGVYVEPVPTPTGFQPEVVADPDVSFVETEPAAPAESPEIDESVGLEIRMD